MIADSKKLFDFITKDSQTTEKRLMIDIAAAKESYNRHDVSNVGLVLSEDNVANGVIKPGFCKVLDDLMKTGFDRGPAQQQIFRNE